MNVIIFIPNLVGAGAEKVALSIYKGLSEYSSVETKVLVQELKGELISQVDEKSLHCLGVRSTIVSFFRLREYLKKNDVDVVLGIMNMPSLMAVLAKMTIAKPKFQVISTVHNDFRVEIEISNKNLKGKIRNLFFSLFMKYSDKIICVSNGISKLASDIWNVKDEKINTIYNPIEIPHITHLKGELCRDYIHIGMVGRLHYQKNYEEIIKATLLVNKLYNINVRVSIVGQGDKIGELQELANKLGVAESINFLGFKSKPFERLKNVDVFCLTSKNEGFGNVLVEAMSLGIPLISSDCDFGPREILNNGEFGLLYPVNNVLRLASAIASLHDKKTYEYYSLKSTERLEFFKSYGSIEKYYKLIAE